MKARARAVLDKMRRLMGGGCVGCKMLKKLRGRR